MSIIIFIIILAVLILVHEFGHFIVAKWSGMRVDEFGLGFPPRVAAWKPKNSETTYSFNWIPFGGFVKIFGEDPKENVPPEPESFGSKSKIKQAGVIVAGVAANIIFAWGLLSIGFMSGFLMPVGTDAGRLPDGASLMISSVAPASPAEEGGIKIGDVFLAITGVKDALQGEALTPVAVSSFIANHVDEQIAIIYKRGEENGTAFLTPKEGIVEGRPAIGITMDVVGTTTLAPHHALWSGAEATYFITTATFSGFWTLIADTIAGNGAGFAAITGPVGIAGLVGDASSLGFAYLLGFTAFISINLAVINIFPFPALDGGRLFFLAIEAIKGSRIKPAVTAWANGIGFVLLILLMVIVTYRDIAKLLHG